MPTRIADTIYAKLCRQDARGISSVTRQTSPNDKLIALRLNFEGRNADFNCPAACIHQKLSFGRLQSDPVRGFQVTSLSIPGMTIPNHRSHSSYKHHRNGHAKNVTRVRRPRLAQFGYQVSSCRFLLQLSCTLPRVMARKERPHLIRLQLLGWPVAYHPFQRPFSSDTELDRLVTELGYMNWDIS